MTATVTTAFMSLWKPTRVVTLHPDTQLASVGAAVSTLVWSGTALEKLEGAGSRERVYVRKLNATAQSCLKGAIQPALKDHRYPVWRPVRSGTV